jgi:hypothetical protein
VEATARLAGREQQRAGEGRGDAERRERVAHREHGHPRLPPGEAAGGGAAVRGLGRGVVQDHVFGTPAAAQDGAVRQ